MTKYKTYTNDPTPSGIYRAWFEGTHERGIERVYVQWNWRITEGEFTGRLVLGNTSINFGPQAKARKWLESMLDRRIEPGEEVDPWDLIDEMIGEAYMIRVENTGSDFGNVADVIGPVENTAPDSQRRVFDNVIEILLPNYASDE